MLEHVTQAVAPPGSTFKLVVAAANQAHPVFAPNQVIPTGASFTYGGHTFGNWKPMGPMNLVESIAISNDVYFYKLAVALGADGLIDTARALGVGEPTGIDLPAESAGYLGTPESVRGEGRRVVRRVHRHPRHRPGRPAGHPAAERPVDRRRRHRDHGHPAARPGDRGRGGHVHRASRAGPDAGAVRRRAGAGPRGDARGRDGGTAVRLAGLPVPVGAKTGTAQDGGLREGEYDNWISAVAPMDAPEIVMTALVQGPGTGANNAKNVVADGLRHYLEHRTDVLATGPVQAP